MHKRALGIVAVVVACSVLLLCVLLPIWNNLNGGEELVLIEYEVLNLNETFSSSAVVPWYWGGIVDEKGVWFHDGVSVFLANRSTGEEEMWYDGRAVGNNPINWINVENDNLWMCTITGDILIMNITSGSVSSYLQEELPGLPMRSSNSENSMWIYTKDPAGNDYICKHRTENGSWEIYNITTHSLDSFFVRDFKIDGNQVWIASGWGVTLFDLTTHVHYGWNNRTHTWENLSSMNITNFFKIPFAHSVELNDDMVWAYNQKDIFFYKKTNQTWYKIPIYNSTLPELNTTSIADIALDGNLVHIGTDNGWFTLDINAGIVVPVDASPIHDGIPVTGITLFQNELWIFSQQGIHAYSRTTMLLERSVSSDWIDVHKLHPIEVG